MQNTMHKIVMGVMYHDVHKPQQSATQQVTKCFNTMYVTIFPGSVPANTETENNVDITGMASWLIGGLEICS